MQIYKENSKSSKTIGVLNLDILWWISNLGIEVYTHPHKSHLIMQEVKICLRCVYM